MPERQTTPFQVKRSKEKDVPISVRRSGNCTVCLVRPTKKQPVIDRMTGCLLTMRSRSEPLADPPDVTAI